MRSHDSVGSALWQLKPKCVICNSLLELPERGRCACGVGQLHVNDNGFGSQRRRLVLEAALLRDSRRLRQITASLTVACLEELVVAGKVPEVVAGELGGVGDGARLRTRRRRRRRRARRLGWGVRRRQRRRRRAGRHERRCLRRQAGHFVDAASVAASVATVLVGVQVFTRNAQVLPEGASLVLAARLGALRGRRRRRRRVGWRAEDLALAQSQCHVSPRLILGRGSDAGEVVEVLDVDGCGHVEDLLQPRCERALVEGIGVDQERGFEEGAL